MKPLFVAALLSGCCGLLAAPAGATAPEEPESELVFLDQGWTDELRELFYFTPQGSRIMPEAWFRALETIDGAGLFSDLGHLETYGLLPPGPGTPAERNGLPIGFAVDPGDEGDDEATLALSPDPVGVSSPGRFVGLTCAACHTATVTVEGRPIRIDGGPAHFDFDSFYADLARTVSATLLDEQRFGRFATRVLGADSLTGAAQLKLQFAAFQTRLVGEATLRRPALASGFGRVDALTQIVNSLAVRDQAEPTNLVPVAAPTSYPPLWLAPDLEFVQWNPIAASPIGRNGGQVLGVFGSADLSGATGEPFASTILLERLHALESWIGELRPPAWDEAIMGPIDRDLAAVGAGLFAENCAGCHNMAPYRRTDPEVNFFGRTFIEIGRVDYRKVGTDPVYVESLAQRLIKTNRVTAPLFDGQDIVPAAAFFLRTAGAVIGKALDDAGLSDAEKAAYNGFRLRRTESGRPAPYSPPSLTDLKASPLAGAWATGPYLHNGSVPTIYELLSPEAERRRVFWTGGRELDRQHLGFISTDAPGRFRFDTTLPGNGNQGHLYPRGGLDHEQRMAIIEYLKTQ
jgi:hypothetical protein